MKVKSADVSTAESNEEVQSADEGDHDGTLDSITTELLIKPIMAGEKELIVQLNDCSKCCERWDFISF